ncbi:hypothetical protein [Erwinia pyrifoliae]|uniref:Uncharacterized protein n=1 Tax=Erwinia pyrifoliae TaxID=79967 RepID=A0ABY5X5A4_ERWPY|nr:hypothetical protein [Erwinia pyrifoliae]AUX72144.1 hypothetical protein CPI84_06455 [Erwinia pyrifoliae]MCA8877615.1 hypothetical protein [Erwinia pyrifoliae]MCT2388395.1 hypothetical protein [Erwinia pyrifoliae]MCU8586565.1 hypothetical protein [Erwinia pyrifoliae]UWS32327.1 hypothetical protein NYP84_11745 [Erwinia pyrifoliae]
MMNNAIAGSSQASQAGEVTFENVQATPYQSNILNNIASAMSEYGLCPLQDNAQERVRNGKTNSSTSCDHKIQGTSGVEGEAALNDNLSKKIEFVLNDSAEVQQRQQRIIDNLEYVLRKS